MVGFPCGGFFFFAFLLLYSNKMWALYIRVSTEEQNSEQQLAMLKEYAARQGWQVRSFVDHGFGRSTVERPELDKMLARAKKGEFEGILSQRVDRVTGNLLFGVTFWDFITEHKLRFVTVYEGEYRYISGDDYFRFMINVLLAERERRILIERTLIGVARAKAEGKFKGGKAGRKWKKSGILEGRSTTPSETDI
jgi:putative DNA-invertase from lambdoid prophage Rac